MAPDESNLLRQIAAQKPRDYTTHLGSGRANNDFVWGLHQKDSRWVHLKKKPGQHQYEGHAVDNGLYTDPRPGQSQAVDFIGSSGSTDGRLIWNPDIPRYSESDWMIPTGPDNFVLPAHNTKLGITLMPLLAHVYRGQGSWVTNQFDTFEKRGLIIDYARFFCIVGGDLFDVGDGTRDDPWKFAGAFLNWPEYDDNLRDSCELLMQYNIKLAPTIFGGAGQSPTLDFQLSHTRRVCNVLKDYASQIEVLEIWNERWATNGRLDWIQTCAIEARHILGPNVRISLDSPVSAVQAPVGETPDGLPDEVSLMMQGMQGIVNAITPQWDRSQPNPRPMGRDCPEYVYSHEPRGPGSTAGTQNELYIGNDYIQEILMDHEGYTFHPGSNVFGLLKNLKFPQDSANYPWDYSNAEAIFDVLKSIRENETPGDGTVPIINYPGDDKFTIVGQILEADYARAGQTLNSGSAVWFSRTIWDNVEGDETGHKYTLDESIAKHRLEWCAALGVPVVPVEELKKMHPRIFDLE